MSDYNSSNTNLNSCPYCEWEFPAEFRKKIVDNHTKAVCEGCGTEIVKGIEKSNDNITNHNRKNLISKIYESVRGKKSPIDRVLDDSDFPLIFIENYIIVAARLIYFHFLELKNERVFDFQSNELTEETIEILFEKFKPITKKRIHPEFLRSLTNMNLKGFERWLRFQQSKVEFSERYSNDLAFFIRWLIKKVFMIISELRDKKELPKLERIIRDDLKTFELHFNDSTLGNQVDNIIYYNSITSQGSLFDDFLNYIHKVEPIKQYIEEFNTSGNWMKNFRPTQTFINFINEKRKKLIKSSKNNRSNTVQDQIEILSNFSAISTKIRENDILNKIIKAKILENPGKYNAYDIQDWFLVSDTSTRNQLNRILTKEEYQQNVRTQTHVSIDTIREITAKKKGKCHTKSLKNAKSKVHLECSEGHHFHTTYDSVVYQDTWCPHCHIYMSEAVCRKFFEKIFQRPFPKSYPEWLINENGNQMELDGYNKDIRLAFEYQGIQHRKKAFGMTDEELKNRQKEDALKLKLCEENGVTLLQIPDDEIVPYDNLQGYIEQEYERKTGKTLTNIPKYDYHEFNIYENKHAKKFREYIEEKGGTLLTPYFSQRKEVTLMCEKGHEWVTTPNSIYQDNWCPECAGNMKGTTEDFRKIGEMFDCELINEYVNAKTPLTYKCRKAHKFTIMSPYWLKRTYKDIENLCPKCTMDVFAEKFQHFVKNKGGQLVTPYKGRFRPITIKCSKNHTWNTTPGAVYQGSLCKFCAEENHPNRERLQSAKKELLQMIKSLKYTLSSEYENNTKIVEIICQNQHQFTMTPKYFKRLVNQNIEPCKKCRNES